MSWGAGRTRQSDQHAEGGLYHAGNCQQSRYLTHQRDRDQARQPGTAAANSAMPPGLSDTSARVSPIMATTPAAISITPAIMRGSHLAVRVDQRIAKVKCGR